MIATKILIALGTISFGLIYVEGELQENMVNCTKCSIQQQEWKALFNIFYGLKITVLLALLVGALTSFIFSFIDVNVEFVSTFSSDESSLEDEKKSISEDEISVTSTEDDQDEEETTNWSGEEKYEHDPVTFDEPENTAKGGKVHLMIKPIFNNVSSKDYKIENLSTDPRIHSEDECCVYNHFDKHKKSKCGLELWKAPKRSNTFDVSE